MKPKIGTRSTKSKSLGENIQSCGSKFSVSMIIPVFSSLAYPTSRSLTLIEWRNKQGERKRFRLKELICHKWMEIGCLLEIPLPVLQSWETEHLKNQLKCTNTVLSHWLENPTDYYPVSWAGLDRLLDNAELGQVAEDLKQALCNTV